MAEDIKKTNLLPLDEAEAACEEEGRLVDKAWCSELCKKKVAAAVTSLYPCRQAFSRIDTVPLFAEGPYRHYRVTLWVKNWAGSTLAPALEMWKSFYVIVEGIERDVVSIEENKMPHLKLSDKGRKFRDELFLAQQVGEKV